MTFSFTTDSGEGSQWLTSALVGAAIAALGFVAKQIAELFMRAWQDRQRSRARLLELASYLRASRASLRAQRKLNKRLKRRLTKRLGALPSGRGFERLFCDLYPKFDDRDKELHALIRATTMHSLRPLNAAMSRWLRSDRTFKVADRRSWLALRSKRAEDWSKLARKLSELEAHLVLWSAKYKVWIPRHADHALVYLNDEQRHGPRFPKGLDVLVNQLTRRAVERRNRKPSEASPPSVEEATSERST